MEVVYSAVELRDTYFDDYKPVGRTFEDLRNDLALVDSTGIPLTAEAVRTRIRRAPNAPDSYGMAVGYAGPPDGVTAKAIAEWNKHLAKLQKRGGMARFAQFGDKHYPYLDRQANDLCLKIVSDFNPDVVAGLNDLWDFSGFSSFADTRPWYKQNDSALTQAVEWMRADMREVHDAAPNAKCFGIEGNHDERLWRHLFGDSKFTADYTQAHVFQDLHAAGILLVEGMDGEAGVDLSPGLRALHGRYATKNIITAIKNTLEMYGNQQSVGFGHIHRAGELTIRGKFYDVRGVAVGCLCELQPHYSKYRQNWHQGVALWTYDPNGYETNVQNIVFNRDGKRLRAFVGGKEYSA